VRNEKIPLSLPDGRQAPFDKGGNKGGFERGRIC